MQRRRRRFIATAAGVALAVLVGCGGGPERAVIDQFFAAARLHDLTTLRAFSTTDFVPTVDGIVTDFEITSISDETPVDLPPGAFAGSEVVRLSAGNSTTGAGTLLQKKVALRAEIRRAAEAPQQQDMVVTLQRVITANGNPGRWIVTGVESVARR